MGGGRILIRTRRGWEIPERGATPESDYLSFASNRRRFLSALAGAGAAALVGCQRDISAQKLEEKIGLFPPDLQAQRNPAFQIDGDATKRAPTLLYNNFCEFTESKDVWRHVESYQRKPWTVEVSGLVNEPRTWDLDELLKMPLEERLYRHRCWQPCA